MNKIILFMLTLVLVSGFVYAAEISGEIGITVPIVLDNNGTADDGDIDFVAGSLYADTNIKASLDGNNGIVLKLRHGTPYILDLDAFFLESDIAGSFGWTEQTGGLKLKVKAGYFEPSTSNTDVLKEGTGYVEFRSDSDELLGAESSAIPIIVRDVGEVKNIIETAADGSELSDVADLNLNNPQQASTEITIGWTDALKLLVGLSFGEGTNFNKFANLFGSLPAGTGVFSYSVYGGENSSSSSDSTIVTAEDEIWQAGVGLEYIDLAMTSAFSLGVGAEGIVTLQPGDPLVNYGLNVVSDVNLADQFDLEFDLKASGRIGGENDTAFINNAGLGISLHDKEEIIGLDVGFVVNNILGNEVTYTTPGSSVSSITQNSLFFGLKPEIWFTPGTLGTEFTVGLNTLDLGNFAESSQIELSAILAF